MYPKNKMAPSIFIPQLFPDQWHEQAPLWNIPAEQDILLKCLKVKSVDETKYFHTGADMTALAFAASFALSTPEMPTISFLARGGFNQLYLLHYQKLNKTVVARVPVPDVQLESINRVPRTVATATFARNVLGIPTPQILAWNADESNPVCAPYIIQEYIDSAVECSKAFCDGSRDQKLGILDELADWHGRFLQPLPPLPSGLGYGDLEFVPGLSDDCDPADPSCYCTQPLRRRWEKRGFKGPIPIQTSSTSLPGLWKDLWEWHYRNCGNGEYLDKDALHIDEDDTETEALVNLESLKDVAERVRLFSEEAIQALDDHPTLGLPCLVQEDFALRNILLDPSTLKIKAFLDLDDVHVLPFVIGIKYPDDICWADARGMPTGSLSVREGDFWKYFPPSAYGKILGAFDENGDLRDEDDINHDQRIRDTIHRDHFNRRLAAFDQRLNHPAVWNVRRMVLKTHIFLRDGGQRWFRQEDWLKRQIDGLLPIL